MTRPKAQDLAAPTHNLHLKGGVIVPLTCDGPPENVEGILDAWREVYHRVLLYVETIAPPADQGSADQ